MERERIERLQELEQLARDPAKMGIENGHVGFMDMTQARALLVQIEALSRQKDPLMKELIRWGGLTGRPGARWKKVHVGSRRSHHT